MSENTIGPRAPGTPFLPQSAPVAAGDLPGAGATTDTAAAGQVGSLEQLQALFAAQSAGATRAANKYSQAGAATGLAQPTLPRLPTTPATQAATQSFLAETQGNLQQAAQLTASQPANNVPVPATLQGPHTPAQATEQLLKWADNQARGGPQLRTASLATFLLSRLTSDLDGAKALQDLSEGVSRSEELNIAQGKARAEESEKAAAKAANKAKKLGIIAPIVEAVVAIVFAALTVISAGGLGPVFAAILAASIAAFVATGVGVGAKNGKGFDFTAAVTAFSTVLSVGGFASIAKAIGQVAIQAVKTALQQAAKVAAKVGIQGAEAGVKLAAEAGVKTATEAGSKAAETAATAATRSVAKESTQTVAEAAGKGAGAGAGAAAQSAESANQSFWSTLNRNLVKQILETTKKGGEASTKAVLGQGATGESAKDIAQAVAKQSAKAVSQLDKTLAWGNIALAGVTSTAESARAGIKYQVAQYNADSKEALAGVNLLKSYVDQAQDVYKATQDTIQGLVRSHDEASKTIGQAIYQQGLIQTRIAQNV